LKQTAFSALSLHPALLENLASLGYHTMTPIQAESLPPILAGKDVIAQGQTGSGKTAAFGLGLLQRLDLKRLEVQALVLCPTRELADQVADEIRRLARTTPNVKVLTLCGGNPFGPQASSLQHGAHIVVGTPGRIEDHLKKEKLKLKNLQTLILDEADRMLDMGFQPALDAIIARTPTQRQTVMLSATYPDEIRSIASRVMTDPVVVTVASSHDSSTIAQHFYQVEDENRLAALRLLLLEHQPESAVVFCNTKLETREIARVLREHGFSTLALNGDLDQKTRDQTLVQFVNRSISVLVATDVAARGLDIDTLDAVINYQPAQNSEVHIHRIGRTGRAGHSGWAATLFSAGEHHKIAELESYFGEPITVEPLPAVAVLEKPTYKPAMTTLQIDGGKQRKVRPGDILGALTSDNGIVGNQVGKIQIFSRSAYVAVSREAAAQALEKLRTSKVKGRVARARRLHS